jgi:hypothetical protein
MYLNFVIMIPIRRFARCRIGKVFAGIDRGSGLTNMIANTVAVRAHINQKPA